MKTHKTHRLPGYDLRTSGAELLAFSGLGLISIAIITMAAGNAAKFADAREDILSSLSSPCQLQPTLAGHGPRNDVTNILHVHTSAVRQGALQIPTCTPVIEGQQL